MTDNNKKIESLADEVLKLSRDTLLVHLRFLDAALSALPCVPKNISNYMTDGISLFYNPEYVLKMYKLGKQIPTRDYLHIALHCTLGHIFPPDGADRSTWDLVCDIACEYTITGLGIPALITVRQQRMEKIFKNLAEHTDMLTAEKLYRYYMNNPADPDELKFLKETFTVDSHEFWGKSYESQGAWKLISKRMQVDMDTFARRQGERAGALITALLETNREISDYDGFLKALAMKSDGMKLDLNEFDYSLYSYGMQLYGKKALLIEPVEYKDSMRIRDFIIVMSLSSSFPGYVAQNVLDHTESVLKSTESYFSKVNIHKMIIPQGESCDFRPVFSEISKLINQKSLSNLRGVIIFSDREGIYPSEMPKYKVATAFMVDDYSIPKVPAWAIRLMLEREDYED